MKCDKPFGGLHILLAGDLYQMKVVGWGSSIAESLDNLVTGSLGWKGCKLLHDNLTDYIVLKKNFRAMIQDPVTQEETPNTFVPVLQQARRAEVTLEGQSLLNSRVIDVRHISKQGPIDADEEDDDEEDVDDLDLESAISEGIRLAHPNAIWVASTHKQIKKINTSYLQDFVKKGKKVYRVVANHVGSNMHIPPPDPATQKHLYSVKGDDKGGSEELHLTHMDLCVGSRVRITENIFVEGGLFNGAMGTVKGFVYRKGEPDPQETTKSFSDMSDVEKEIPVVLVQLDGDETTHRWGSCSQKVPRLVPIAARVGIAVPGTDYKRVQLPLRVAHARTGHTAQGITAHYGVVVWPGSKFFGGDYVAISRGKKLEDIWLLKPVRAVNFTAENKFRQKVDAFYKSLAHKERLTV